MHLIVDRSGLPDVKSPSVAIIRKRFTKYSADNVGCLLRLAQAAGVTSTIRLNLFSAHLTLHPRRN
jgi:hypothetical protein